ncbi:MAG: SaoD/DsrE family protein [Flavobacteriaceae bacterium]|jgi:sulfur relay (sulfurtransferase) complex TusBCD TusD component (DsrE family)
MKIAYIFKTNMASSFQLATMILPQLENNKHVAEVAGMFFFDENINILRKGDAFGERLAKVAKEKGILLMACDQCAVRRGLANGTLEQCGSGDVTPKGMIDGALVGCFPQLYQALAPAGINLAITL